MEAIENAGKARFLPRKEASMNEENYVSYDESIHDYDNPLDKAGRDYSGTIPTEPKVDARLQLKDLPRKGMLDLFSYAVWAKSGGGSDYWGVSFFVTPNVDPNLFRSKDFRLQALLPPYDERPTDKNIYCTRPSGEVYAVFSYLGWRRNRRLGQLNLAEYQASLDMYLDRSAVTEGLVHYFGTQWGMYLRNDGNSESIPCGWPDADERVKLGISGHGFKRNNSYISFLNPPDVPIKGMPKNALEFHRAWMKLDNERFRVVLWVYFVPNATEKEKAEALALTLDGYRFLVEDAINAVIRRMLTRDTSGA